MEWYPHNIIDYDADTLHLTIAQNGAYLRLLHWYYLNERPLPYNENALAAICHCTVDEWRELEPVLIHYFVTRDSHDGNGRVLHHNRCNDTINVQTAKRKDARERQRKHRKRNILSDVTRDEHVSHAPRGEERRGESIDSKREKGSVGSLRSPLSKPQTPEIKKLKKEQWQGKILRFAKERLSSDRFMEFVAGFAAGEEWANTQANKLDVEMRKAKWRG